MKQLYTQQLLILGLTAQSGIHMDTGVMPDDYDANMFASGTSIQYRGDVEEEGRGFHTAPQIEDEAAPEESLHGHVLIVDPDETGDDRVIAVVKSNFVPDTEALDPSIRATRQADLEDDPGWADVRSNFVPDTEALSPDQRLHAVFDEGEPGEGFVFSGEVPEDAPVDPEAEITRGFVAEFGDLEPGWAQVQSNFVPDTEALSPDQRVYSLPDEGEPGWADVKSNFVPDTEALDSSFRLDRSPDTEDDPGAGFVYPGEAPADVTPDPEAEITRSFFVQPDEEDNGLGFFTPVETQEPEDVGEEENQRAEGIFPEEDEPGLAQIFPGEVPADVAANPIATGSGIAFRGDIEEQGWAQVFPGEVPADFVPPEFDPEILPLILRAHDAEDEAGYSEIFPGEAPADVVADYEPPGIVFVQPDEIGFEGQGFVHQARLFPVFDSVFGATSDYDDNAEEDVRGFQSSGVIPEDIPPLEETQRRVDAVFEDGEAGGAVIHSGVIPDDVAEDMPEGTRLVASFDPLENGKGFAHSGNQPEDVVDVGEEENARVEGIFDPEDEPGRGFFAPVETQEPVDVGEEENHRVYALHEDGVDGSGFHHSGVAPDDVFPEPEVEEDTPTGGWESVRDKQRRLAEQEDEEAIKVIIAFLEALNENLPPG